MKTKAKHLISQTVSFISDIAIIATGLDETTEVKKLVTDFFMYSSLLLQHLRNRLADASRYIGLRMAKYKAFVACLLLVPAGTAVMLHCNQATILILFVLMIMAILLMKKEADKDGFVKNSLPKFITLPYNQTG